MPQWAMASVGVVLGVSLLFVSVSPAKYTQPINDKVFTFSDLGTTTTPKTTVSSNGGDPIFEALVKISKDLEKTKGEVDQLLQIVQRTEPSVVKKKYVVFPSKKMSWGEAMVYCKSEGLMLATINNEEEQRELESAIERAHYQITEGTYHGFNWVVVWIAATKFEFQQEYVWASTGRLVNFTYWADFDLNVLGSNCVVMAKIYGNHWMWYQTKCDFDFAIPACEQLTEN